MITLLGLRKLLNLKLKDVPLPLKYKEDVINYINIKKRALEIHTDKSIRYSCFLDYKEAIHIADCMGVKYE